MSEGPIFSDDPRNHASLELLLYQVGELRRVTDRGFDKINGRLVKLEEAVAEHDTKIAVLETRDQDDHRETPLWAKVALAALGVAGTALGVVAAVVPH